MLLEKICPSRWERKWNSGIWTTRGCVKWDWTFTSRKVWVVICGAGNAKIVTTEMKLRPGDLEDLESESASGLESGSGSGSGPAASGVANKLILTVLSCRQSYEIRLCLFVPKYGIDDLCSWSSIERADLFVLVHPKFSDFPSILSSALKLYKQE